MELNAKRNAYLKALLIAVIATAFGLLLWKFDFEILFFIKDHVRNSFLDVIVPFYTNLGDDGIIWIAVGLIMLIPKKTRKCGIMVLAALLVMLVVNNIILKNLIARPRPCATYPELVELVHIPTSYSFPSGHTVSAMAVAFTILTQHKKLGIVAVIMASAAMFCWIGIGGSIALRKKGKSRLSFAAQFAGFFGIGLTIVLFYAFYGNLLETLN